MWFQGNWINPVRFRRVMQGSYLYGSLSVTLGDDNLWGISLPGGVEGAFWEAVFRQEPKAGVELVRSFRKLSEAKEWVLERHRAFRSCHPSS